MVDATGANRAYVHHEQGWGEGPFAVTVHGDRDVWADTEDVHDRWVVRPGSQRFDSSLQELAERGWPTSFLAAQLETTPHTLAAIRGRERRRLVLAPGPRNPPPRLAALLLASEPADHGIAEHRSRRTRLAALQRAQPVQTVTTVVQRQPRPVL
ncbi:hypothetical protein [Streptomyces sp. NPDC060010]|uniref:hypothetical protein n=1 Tax=Streptomyces sp. NPDC060010 TaxID=3347036 RepID=UPI00368D82CB